MGTYLDPANNYDIWMLTEYAANINTWGTYVGQIRMVPFTGIYTYLSTDILSFGNVEINTVSDTLDVVIANYGTDDLEISSVASDVGPFTRIPGQTFPQTLQTYDSLTIRVIFSPTEPNDYDDILSITSNDPDLTGIQLTGHSYEILIPYSNWFYASSGGGNNGDMMTIDPDSGVGTILGPSLYGEVKGLAVNPLNDGLYGLVSGNNSEIVRVNAGQGDSYTLVTLDLVGLTGMDFDTSGTLYACQQDGDIFSIDITNGNYTLVTTATHGLNAITFNPTTNELWGALRKTFGNYKDSVYTIDLTTGEATPVGRTGLTVPTTDMAFDGQGNLYGVSGTSNQEGQFFQIDQTTGAGTLVGTGVGYNHTTGLAYSINGPVLSVDGGNSTLPQNYSLKQNFPNPFNPSTKIKYSIPEMSIVTLTLFNLLGEEVTTLVNEEKTAGNYTVEFNAANLPSGIYFYRIQAGSFVETKKMVLIK